MRTVAILQARLASTRLPGKVIAPILGEPLIARMMDRLQLAKSLDEIVIAMPTGGLDDILASYCLERGWAIYRGDEHDVLGRYRGAAEASNADTVVRVTADCPLIDPFVIDAMVALLHGSLRELPPYDFVSNNLTPTFPHGCDAEAFSRWTLGMADALATQSHDREHVSPWMTRASAGGSVLRLCNFPAPNGMDYSWMRLTVDYPEDLDLVRAIYEHFGVGRYITIPEVAAFLALRPGLVALNAKHHRRPAQAVGQA